MRTICSWHMLAVLVAIGIISSRVISAGRGGNSVLRAVVPSEIKWNVVSGYPSGYARAMLEGEADKAGPFTYRVRLPAGFTFQPHTHARDEHVTVLEGVWSLGIGGTFDASRLRSFPAGSFVVVAAGTPHFVATETDTIVQVHGMGPIGFESVGAAGGTPPR
jgi:quercetin dioxygenase-like cupin family protein